MECFFGGFFVAKDDLGRMESHSDKIFGMVEKLTSKGDGEVGGVSAFFFLHFACHLKHFSGRMLDLELFEDGSGITGDKSFIDMVDNHFFEC